MFKNFKIPFSILILYTIYFQPLRANKSCNIKVKNDLFRRDSPIFVSLNGSGTAPKYIYPTKADPDHITISSGETLKVFCPGKTKRMSTEIGTPAILQISNKDLKPPRSIETIECANNGKFKIHNNHDMKDVNLNEINCKATSNTYIYNAIIRKKNKECGNGERYEIGYDLGKYGFLETIDLCHNVTRSTTIWAHTQLEPTYRSNNRKKNDTEEDNLNIGRKTCLVGPLYKKLSLTSKINGPYRSENQFKSVFDLLHDDDKAKGYISSGDGRYLVIGHLIARADKFYRSEQDSTYFFANTVPMWQQINAPGGNWYFVENYLRRLAFDKNSPLDVWAGGIGVLDLQKKSNQNKNCRTRKNQKPDEPKLLFLSKKIPVPQVLFKCAVDKSRKKGLCFLVVNNPYLSKSQVEDSGNKYILCPKLRLCERFHLNYDKKGSGYFYCCKLHDFIEKFEEELNLQDIEEFKNYKEIALVSYHK